MFVEAYYSQSGDNVSFTREQASDFAKNIAGDFNPIHDPDNKRFCVPGDLLFSVILSRYGVSQSMVFDFQGMVGDAPVKLLANDQQIQFINDADKLYLTASRQGDVSQNSVFVDGLIRSYVAFSGKTFPHILVELMKQEGVMVNAARPTVIYDQMKISFDTFAQSAPEVLLLENQFDVDGKRGLVTMKFDIQADGRSIGKGENKSSWGLKPYEQAGIDELVANYEASKARFIQ